MRNFDKIIICLLGLIEGSFCVERYNSSIKVIIIGAGIAGLSTGLKLIENGVTDILIIEARNRTGGRIDTHLLKNVSFIDLGAQFVSQEFENPLYDLLNSLNLTEIVNKTPLNKIYYATQFESNKNRSIDSGYVESIKSKLDDLLVESSNDLTLSIEDTSLMNLFNKKFNNFLRDYVEKNSLNDDHVKILKAIYRERLHREIIATAFGPLEYVSANGWNLLQRAFDVNTFLVKNGYIGLINYLLSKIGSGKIQFNEAVTNIDYSNVENSENQKLKLTSVDVFTKKVYTYEADYCLSTIPLGYLKGHYNFLFTPRLPRNRKKAIEAIGSSTLNRIFLIFENNFDENVENMQILWTDETLFRPDLSNKCNISDDHFYFAFGSFSVLPYSRNILQTAISGQNAIYAEKLSDDCLLTIINQLLKMNFADLLPGSPVKLIRSNWFNERFSRASYSFMKFNSTKLADVKLLAEPLASKVFFAGDYTSTLFFGTTSGAFHSGIREAKNIIELINTKINQKK